MLKNNYTEKYFGDVCEWFKQHAWKVCVCTLTSTVGSNPTISAIFNIQYKKIIIFNNILLIDNNNYEN